MLGPSFLHPVLSFLASSFTSLECNLQEISEKGCTAWPSIPHVFFTHSQCCGLLAPLVGVLKSSVSLSPDPVRVTCLILILEAVKVSSSSLLLKNFVMRVGVDDFVFLTWGVSWVPSSWGLLSLGAFEMFSHYFFDNVCVSSVRKPCQLFIGLPESILYSFILPVFSAFCFSSFPAGFLNFILIFLLNFYVSCCRVFISKKCPLFPYSFVLACCSSFISL